MSCLNLPDICLTVDVPVDTGGVCWDIEVRPVEQEHSRRECWSFVHHCDGNTTVVHHIQRTSVVDLQDNIIISDCNEMSGS